MQNNQNKKCVLVDANNFIYRYYYGMPPQLNKNGDDYRILYGMMRLINNIPREIDDLNYLFLVFDPDDSDAYRKSIYPAYKQNRPPAPADLVKQREDVINIMKQLGVPIIEYSGVESDDIIASSAKYFANMGIKVNIFAKDKDLMQIINNDINVYQIAKKDDKSIYKIFNQQLIYDHYGVTPSQIPDYLALIGDTADNIPGADGIGPKTATKLIQKYNNLETIIACREELSEKVKKSIMESMDYLPISKKLNTLRFDLDITNSVLKAISEADQTQSHLGYKQKVLDLKHEFSWPDYFVSLFINNHQNIRP